MDIIAAKSFIRGIRERMDLNRDHLIELDSVMGDGDLGLTMTKAFAAADELSARYVDNDVGSFFAQCGMAMAKAAPSTMGTLMGTGFMRGGKSVQGKTILEAQDVARFFRAFAQGIADRGKCAPGEKTILDVIDPVASALENAVAKHVSLPDLAEIARAAGDTGLEAAKAMMAQHGKAAIYREQTCGKPDPGATAGMFMIDAFCSVLE